MVETMIAGMKEIQAYNEASRRARHLPHGYDPMSKPRLVSEHSCIVEPCHIDRSMMDFIIREMPDMTVTVTDWSGCRSPGRARRRLRQGHLQHVRHHVMPDPKVTFVGNVIVGHPETIKKFLNQIPVGKAA